MPGSDIGSPVTTVVENAAAGAAPTASIIPAAIPHMTIKNRRADGRKTARIAQVSPIEYGVIPRLDPPTAEGPNPSRDRAPAGASKKVSPGAPTRGEARIAAGRDFAVRRRDPSENSATHRTPLRGYGGRPLLPLHRHRAGGYVAALRAAQLGRRW